MSAQRGVTELLEGHAIIRRKYQITVPAGIVSVLDLEPGDTLRFAARSDGYVTVEVQRLRAVPTPLSEAVAVANPQPAPPLRVVPEPETVQW